MTDKKYILFSLDDDEAKNLGEAISSKTSRAIVNFLVEKGEASETDISKNLNIPINTAEYNLKKLLKAGVIEKSKNFFWSKKGKKIDVYKVANKLIVIAPKKSSAYSKLKSVIPVALISGILTYFIFWYAKIKSYSFGVQETIHKTTIETLNKEVTREAATKVGESALSSTSAAIPVISNISNITEKAAENISNITYLIRKEYVSYIHPQIWVWFLLGTLIAILAFLIWNWKKL